MRDRARDRLALDFIARGSDDRDFHTRLCAYPMLLRDTVRDRLRKSLKKGRTELIAVLARADEFAPRIVAGEVPYILGCGPVEMLAEEVRRGAIAMETAMKAVVLSTRDQLLPVYVRAVSNYAVQLAHETRWREGLPLMRLMCTALDATPDSEEKTQNLDVAESAFVETAIGSLVEVPDRRLLEDAERAGLRVVSRTDPSKSDDHGLALMRLGVIHLDPFVKFRDLGNHRGAYQHWHEAFVREYGASAAKIPTATWHMPPLEEALGKATNYLRRAADARTGPERGRSLKALAEAVSSRALVAGTTRSPEAAEIAIEALTLLDPSVDQDHILSLEGLLRKLGDSRRAPSGVEESALEGPRRVPVVLESAASIRATDPRAALETLRDARQLFSQHGLPLQRQSRLRQMAMLLRPAFAPGESPETWGSGWEEKVRAVLTKGQSGTLSGYALAACVLELAFHSIALDREQQALPLVDIALEIDPSFAKEYEDVARFLTYLLYEGVGVNNFKAGNYAKATTAYLAAMGGALLLHFDDAALDMVERANDALKKAEVAVFPEHALELLGSNWLECERHLREAGAMELVKAATYLDRCVDAGSEDDFKTRWLLWQIAKGLRFGSSLRPVDQRHTKVETDLLEEIRDLERTTRPEEESDPINEERFLVSWLRPKASGGGLRSSARLANLQHVFDRTREDRAASGEVKARFLRLDEAMEYLGEDSALVSMFLGESPEGKLAVRVQCLSKGHGYSVQTDHAAKPQSVLVEETGYELILPPLGEMVRTVRELIRGEPGFRPVSAEAAIVLRALEDELLGNLRTYITGKPKIKHLCFWPHGPLHFMPLHLLGELDSPLADVAVVTYVPSLALLARERSPVGAGILSIGLERNNRNLAPLVDAPAEAAEIAIGFETEPLPESHSTPETVLERMPGRRYVHIATHGAQNAMAPAFQYLLLNPGANGEDRLFAHDLDGVNLLGVDLVTLSACESALGRIDPSDNLRGFAASLLRAGVRTLIGTLWPTGSKTCRTFFVSLYRELRGGASKRDAFATAQRETRRQYPQYRAWGAFYLMGDWQ